MIEFMFAIFGLDDAVIAGLLATAAGAGLSYAGQRRSSKAQQQVMEDYRERNKVREAEAAQVFDESLSQSGRDDFDSAQAEGEARRESAYERLGGLANGQALPTTSTGNRILSGPTAVNRATVKNTGNAWNKLVGGAQAKLGATSDWRLGQSIKDARANQELGRISTNARSDLSNVVPVEMLEAQHKGDALNNWGQLLSTVGTLAGVGGATGVSPWATLATGASATASPYGYKYAEK